MIGSLIRDIDLGKKDTLNKLLSKVPHPNEAVLQHRLRRLKDNKQRFNGDDDDDNDNNNLPRPGPPPPPPRFLSPPRFDFGSGGDDQFYFPHSPPQAPPPPQSKPPFFPRLFPKSSTSSSNVPGKAVMSVVERVIEKKEKERELKVPDDPVTEYFDKAANVLDFEFFLEKEKKESELEEFKKEFGLDRLV